MLLVVVNILWLLFLRTTGTTPVWNSNGRRQFKDLVMVVQVWNQWVLWRRNECWDESSVVHRIPTDWIKLFTSLIVD